MVRRIWRLCIEMPACKRKREEFNDWDVGKVLRLGIRQDTPGEVSLARVVVERPPNYPHGSPQWEQSKAVGA